MKPWLNRLRTYLSRVLAVPDTEHLYDDDPVRYYRGRSGDDEAREPHLNDDGYGCTLTGDDPRCTICRLADEWPVHGEDPR